MVDIKHRLVFFAAIAVLAAAVMIFVYNPESACFYPRCPLSLLGISCPGCGTLRALHYYLHGNFVRAFGFNPLLPFGVLFVLLIVVWPGIARHVWVPPVVGAVLVAYTVVRNAFGF